MYRHKLDGGGAKRGQIFDGGAVCDSCVCSAHLLRNVGMPRCETLDMHLVNHCRMPGGSRPAIGGPVEEWITYDRAWDVGRTVFVISGIVRFSDIVRKQRRRPAYGSLNRFDVRI